MLLHQIIVWVTARPVLTRSHFMWQHEVCAYGWRTGKVPSKPPANSHSVWTIDQIGESDGIHPTQKPVELARRPILYQTQLGDICYEPFSGSGTTIAAAELTGRRCYAMEISPAFVDVAVAGVADPDQPDSPAPQRWPDLLTTSLGPNGLERS